MFLELYFYHVGFVKEENVGICQPYIRYIVHRRSRNDILWRKIAENGQKTADISASGDLSPI